MNHVYALALVFLSFCATAQQATVKGRITTSDGLPAEFVNVVLKGTNQGTTANQNGDYELTNLKAGDYTLQVSFVGLEAQNRQITLMNDQTLTVPTTKSG